MERERKRKTDGERSPRGRFQARILFYVCHVSLRYHLDRDQQQKTRLTIVLYNFLILLRVDTSVENLDTRIEETEYSLSGGESPFPRLCIRVLLKSSLI